MAFHLTRYLLGRHRYPFSLAALPWPARVALYLCSASDRGGDVATSAGARIPRVSVVIPVYNERMTVGEWLERVRAAACGVPCARDGFARHAS